MKLQDIFTSLEMTDGLASHPSVEKLVAFMQHDKSCATKNIVEVTRQWSTIASIITATQDMDCLKQFIELGGLHILEKWLQEVHKFGNINDGEETVEELLSTVFEVLIKLPMDQHLLKGCGIASTVRHFHSHKNPKIRGKAKNLSDDWKKFTDKDTEFEKHRDRTCADHGHNGFKAETLPKVERDHSSCGQAIPPPKDVPAADCAKEDASSWKAHQSSSVSSSSALQFEAGMVVKDNISAEGNSGTTSSRSYGFASSTGWKEVPGDESPKNGEGPKNSLGRLVSAQHVPVKTEVGSETEKSFNQEENEELDAGEGKRNQVTAGEGGLRSMMLVAFDDRQSKTESSSSNSKPAVLPVSSSSDSCQKKSLEAESCSGNKIGSGMSNSVCISFKCSLAELPARSVTWGISEHGSLDQWKKIMEQNPEKEIDSRVAPKAMLDASVTFLGKHCNLGKPSQVVETFASVTLPGKQGNMGNSQAIKSLRASDTGKILATIVEKKSVILEKIDLPKARLLQQKNAEHMIKDETEMDLKYEMDDALEVARQVAREVEKEVGIYREASGSSSSIGERNGQIVHMSTADSAKPKTKDSSAGIMGRSESCSEQVNPDSCCSTKEEMGPEMLTRNEQLCLELKDPSQEPTIIGENDDCIHDQESSQLTTVPEDVAANDQRTHFCVFDLNEDIMAEEVEYPELSVTETISSIHAVNVATPIPVVATSRVSSCMPTIPLQFEGELGWRGPAATSAFHPAPFCRTPNKEKVSSADGNNCSSKHLHGIDLNVADGGDDSVMKLFTGKHVSLSSGLPSGDSSVEVSSRGVEKLNLDLNCLGDNDDNCPNQLSEWQMEDKLHHHVNGAHSHCATSLSRPFIRDFDLNDNPSLGDASSDVYRLGQGIQSLRDGALDGSTVSIMGTTIQLHTTNVISSSRADLGFVQDFDHGHGRKEFLHSAKPFLMAGPNAVTSIEQMGTVVALQPTLAYAPPPAFSYNNGFGVGPPVPLPSSKYPPGMLPYIIDTRGSPIIPQILGSSTLPSFPRTPYLTEVAGGPGPGDIAIFRPSLDLNTGVTSSENESRGNIRQLFIPATHSLMEEQMKSFQQVASSGQSMKRKEPESGWESFQLGYKQVTSWH